MTPVTDAYLAFLAGKSAAAASVGFDVDPSQLHPSMFPHQRDVTRWALRRGRAALFLDTGLGKTLCLLEWADQVAKHCPIAGVVESIDEDGVWIAHDGQRDGLVLVVAPLAVAEQIVREAAEKWHVPGVVYRRSQADIQPSDRIVVTNYEMVGAFAARDFAGIVLDESSRLKNETGAQRNALIEFASDIPYRLCCSATPAPNDHTELGSHSEFLGIKSRTEMLAEHFVHDGGSTQDWRLKGHARGAFFAWLASWGAYVRKPSDLGYDDSTYELPPLRMHEVIVPADHDAARADGRLFADEATSLSAQRATRRATLSARVAEASRIASEPGACIVWCELNDEADACEKAIPGAIQVAGSDDPEAKKTKLLGFASGEHRVLVSKAKIAGSGMNFQGCARMVFVGASHSYEQTYQSIRRCWRFGQTSPVDVYIIRAENESAVIENYNRKAAAHEEMAREMGTIMGDAMRAEIQGARREWGGREGTTTMQLPGWLTGASNG